MMMMMMMIMMMMTLQVGDNILGVHQWIDIERTYDVEKITSDRSVDKNFIVLVSASNLRITTHMQHDQMVIDFGFLTNTGNSKYWESDDSTDNVFQIWIGIEFSDHQVINLVSNCCHYLLSIRILITIAFTI